MSPLAVKAEPAGPDLGPPALKPLDWERERLQAVRDCRQLDDAAEARFGTILSLVEGVFKVPIVVVGLIETDHLVGVAGRGPLGCAPMKRLHSFCDASLRLGRPTLMVVEDTLQDARFQLNQFVVGEPHVRFYGGAPLVSSEGHILGSLGMMDTVPRTFPADLFSVLVNCAELVVRELERDKALALQRQRAAHPPGSPPLPLVRALSCFNEAILLCDLEPSDASDWRVMYTNEPWAALSGLPTAPGDPLWDLLQLPGPGPGLFQEDALGQMREAVAQRQPFTVRMDVRGGSGCALMLSFHPASADQLEGSPLVGIPSFVQLEEGGGGGGRAHYVAIAKEWVSEPLPLSQLPSLALSRGASTSGSGSVSGLSAGAGASSILSSPVSLALRYGLEQPEALQGLKLGPLLGRGAYAKVYRGIWRGACVAVKVLDTWVHGPPGAAVLAPPLEALLSRSFPHPHIVQVYAFSIRAEQDSMDGVDGVEGDEWSWMSGEGSATLQRTWIVQQYCNHGTLYDAVDRGWLRTRRALDGPPDMLAVLRTAQEVASALSLLHANGVLHGDLTGNNVLLSSSTKDARRFTALVGDFGLARILQGDDPLEATTLGTVTHMPPELLRDAIITKAVDVYSFGCILYEMVSGQRAWCGRGASQVVHMVATLGLRLEMPAGTPPALKALAHDCMNPDHTARPTFDHILERLEPMLRQAKLEHSVDSSVGSV